VQNALVKRHIAQKPNDCKTMPTSLLDEAKKSVADLSDAFMRWYHYFEVLGEWYKKWPEARREQIIKSRAIDPVLYGKIKAFVKFEVGYKRPSKARLIQGYRYLACQCESGPITAAMQKAYCEVFKNYTMANGCSVTLASGMTHQELGDWMTRVMKCGATHFYERDGKNWDRTMGKLHHELEMEFAQVIEGQGELCNILKQTVHRKGFSVTKDGVVRYKSTYTTASGFNNTTIRNTLINAAIALETLKYNDKIGHVIAMGDDLIVAVESDFDINSFVDLEFNEFGINPEARKFSHPCDLTFISACWYPHKSGYSFGPLIGKQLAKLFWTVKAPPKKKTDDWYYSICTGMLTTFRDCPVMQPFLQSHYREGQWMPTGKWTRDNSPLLLTQAEFSRYFLLKYGLTAHAVRKIESMFDGKPSFLSSPYIDQIFEAECSDLYERPEAFGGFTPGGLPNYRP